MSGLYLDEVYSQLAAPFLACEDLDTNDPVIGIAIMCTYLPLFTWVVSPVISFRTLDPSDYTFTLRLLTGEALSAATKWVAPFAVGTPPSCVVTAHRNGRVCEGAVIATITLFHVLRLMYRDGAGAMQQHDIATVAGMAAYYTASIAAPVFLDTFSVVDLLVGVLVGVLASVLFEAAHMAWVHRHREGGRGKHAVAHGLPSARRRPFLNQAGRT